MRYPGCVCLALWILGGGVSSFAAPAKTPRVFEKNDSIEVLRAKIAHNGYSFTVGRNRVYDMPAEQKERFFSRRMSDSPRALAASDDIGPLEKHLSAALPESFDWRSRNGCSYIGPVRDQGDCGSCYAFGAAAAAEGTYNFALGLYDGACADFSEAFIVWCLGSLPAYEPHFGGGCDGGADYDYMELEALTQEGIPDESVFPYADHDQPCPSLAWSATKAVFSSWYRVPCNDVDAIKTAIMTYGVVDAAVYVDTAFQAYRNGVYQNTSTTCPGGSVDPRCDFTATNHAISLVGWDDSDGTGYWILRNSWGTSWGEDGYMRIRYTSARVACEACYLVYRGGPVATPTPAPASPPTPTPVPPVFLAANGSFVAPGESLVVDATVQMLWLTVDAWGVVFGPGGTVYSFVPWNPGALRAGAVPLGTDIPGFWAPASYRLLEMTIPPGVQGEYRIVVGLVPAGIVPTGPESTVPGYVNQKTVTVR